MMEHATGLDSALPVSLQENCMKFQLLVETNAVIGYQLEEWDTYYQ